MKFPELIIFVGILAVLAAGYFATRPPEKSRPSVSIYSASDSAGGYIVDGMLQTYSPTPVEMIAKASGLACKNCSINGWQLSEMLAGGDIAFSAPAGASMPPLAEQLDADPARIIYMGAGLNDCLFSSLSLSEYLTMVNTAVSLITSRHKIPVLRGFHRFAQNDLITAEKMARRDEWNDALQAYAHTAAVPFIDMGAVRFDPATDIAADGLHPTLAYHQRLADYAGDELAHLAS
jgi:hypothetical protein